MSDKNTAKAKVASVLRNTEFHFIPDAPILLYPVRTIRRKNTIEAGLIATCSKTPVNLISTLPGVSAQEAPYSDMIEQCYRERLIPGAWGVGDPGKPYSVPFREMVGASDILVSSSVLEGFGYLFINALQWGKPLFARYLDTLEGILRIFDDFEHFFYDILLVPITNKQKRRIEELYTDHISRLSSVIPKEIQIRLQQQVRNLLHEDEDTLEFSYLPTDMQIEVLKRAQELPFAHSIRELNPRIFDNLEALLTVEASPEREKLAGLFSFESYASVVSEIMATLKGSSSTEDSADRFTEKKIADSVRDRFADIRFIRLLYQ
jgi:hypothetical protein